MTRKTVVRPRKSGDASRTIAAPKARPAFRGCVVITPSTDATHWRWVVSQAAAAAGLAVVAIDTGGTVEEPAGDVVYLTNDPELGWAFEPTHWAAIMSRPETGGGVDLPTLLHASSLMAKLADLPPETRVLTDHDLILTPEPVILFDRFQIVHNHGPLAPWTVQYPAAEALAVFSHGVPGIGAAARWTPEVFAYDKRDLSPDQQVGKFDLSGRARHIVFGPYLWLTPGVWRVRAVFSLDEAASWRRYRLEWGPSRDCTLAALEPGKPGVYEVELTHNLTATAPVELKFVLTESVLSGHFQFMGAEVEMIGAPVRTASEEPAGGSQ